MTTLSHNIFLRCAILLLMISTAFACTADTSSEDLITIQGAWVRPTNPGQAVGAAYMTLTSKEDVSLVSVEADISKNVEIHSMSMENGVMKMRMLETLPLKAGVPYKLAPGGFHLMLFDLKKPLAVDEQVDFVLTFKKNNNVTFKQTIKASVQNPA
ncbi:MAG: copper chaperone PCu(A)C [Methylotenera sp.]|nr:copper chaperone PCu(A)C [Methylotenera sp.]MDZ4141074.1 copper chaperone PCu(A)C [Methylotenera sp.]